MHPGLSFRSTSSAVLLVCTLMGTGLGVFAMRAQDPGKAKSDYKV